MTRTREPYIPVTCQWCGWTGDPVHDVGARHHLVYAPATCPKEEP